MEVLSETEIVIKYKQDKYARFTQAHADEDGTPGGVPTTAKIISPESIKLPASKTQFSPEVEEDKLFMELLTSWGGEWMWSDLRLAESTEWVPEYLKNRTLMCVTYGSYQKEKLPTYVAQGGLWCARRLGGASLARL